jgi:hypothetical protein
MRTDTATDLETEDTANPFGAFAKVFSALAEFFGNPAVQQAGRKLFADLEVRDSIPRLSPVGDSRPALTAGEPERMLE